MGPNERPDPAGRTNPVSTPTLPVDRLPYFPWDLLLPDRATASAHPDGLVDLSVGSPVDRVPPVARAALAEAANAPGYPTVHGTAAVREAYVGWLSRAHGVSGVDPADVLPTLGSKELIAALPAQLGVGPGDTVVIPEIAYPTYEVGALLAGAQVRRADRMVADDAVRVPLVWLNSPSNPTGRVLSVAHLAKVVAWGRANGAVVVCDECYLDLGWETTPVSVLHQDVCGNDYTGILAVHSLSKRSNLAGYRAGFVAGDPDLVAALTALRRHTGAIMPAPIQAAAAAVLGDDGHVMAQRERYATRRAALLEAFEATGFTVTDSEAGLYLWATRREPAMTSVHWLAERGIMVAPGFFYGPAGAEHIRVALTALDERVASACARLKG